VSDEGRYRYACGHLHPTMRSLARTVIIRTDCPSCAAAMPYKPRAGSAQAGDAAPAVKDAQGDPDGSS
jgi:hypothetical protein